jgi:hypothetical protein
MFTLRSAVVGATAVAWLGLSAFAQSQSGEPAYGQPQTGMAAQVPSGMQQAVLFDPVVGVNAFTVNYPAGWHYQGRLWQGDACTPIAVPVFRVSSPDGLSVIERMPSYGWNWGNAAANARPRQGCMDIQQNVSAQDFVKYMSSMLKVEYVADDPIPKDVVDKSQANLDRLNAMNDRQAANGGPLAHQWGDMAVAKVRFRNGTYAMEGRVSTQISCIGTRSRGFRGQFVERDACEATVAYLYAPESQFAAMWAQRDAIGARPVPGYMVAWQAAMQRRTQQNIAAMNAASQASAGVSQNAFAQQQAAQLQAHNQFLSTMQAGTNASMQRAAQVANTQHTIASDYVDYALGQQTVRDQSGQSAKVAAGSAVTWLSADGTQSYQSPDPNANPNGVLPGAWNRGQQTHGDGSPY